MTSGVTGRFGRRNRGGHGINAAPLIDVLLVLLVIMMLTTRNAEQQLTELRIAIANGPALKSDSGAAPITLLVECAANVATGCTPTYRLRGEVKTLEGLTAALDKLDPGMVTIQGAQDVSMQQVGDVVSLLNSKVKDGEPKFAVAFHFQLPSATPVP